MEKGRKKETEAGRGRERKIHIISTIRTFHSSRRYSTLHFFPLPSYLSLAFIFLSFFFFSFFLIYPRPFQRIISCAELLVPGVFSSPLPPIAGRRSIYSKGRPVQCVDSRVSSWLAAKFHFSCVPVPIITLSSGKEKKREIEREERRQKKKRKMKIASTRTKRHHPGRSRIRGNELQN